MAYAKYDSPLGPILLQWESDALTGLWLNRPVPEDAVTVTASIFHHQMLLRNVAVWLDDYFRGEIPDAAFTLAPQGTAFQKAVWDRLRQIPYGQTVSYGDIAREIASVMGKEKMSAQAVGQAVGRNPISIIIPCHRVVGSWGQLTGYAGGLEKKIWLLEHECRKGEKNDRQ